MPPARQPDQSAPRTVSPTGVTHEGPEVGRDPRAQAGEFPTSAQGVRLPDTDHSLEAGRLGIVAGPDADVAGITALRTALEARGAVTKVIAPVGGELGAGADREVVERTFLTARSVEFDAVVVADGAPEDGDLKAVVLLQEAFRQLKTFGSWGDGAEVLAAAGIDTTGPGVLRADSGAALADGLLAALGMHRVWERADLVTASAVPPAA